MNEKISFATIKLNFAVILYILKLKRANRNYCNRNQNNNHLRSKSLASEHLK